MPCSVLAASLPSPHLVPIAPPLPHFVTIRNVCGHSCQMSLQRQDHFWLRTTAVNKDVRYILWNLVFNIVIGKTVLAWVSGRRGGKGSQSYGAGTLLLFRTGPWRSLVKPSFYREADHLPRQTLWSGETLENLHGLSFVFPPFLRLNPLEELKRTCY